jgi:uncharacterized protein YqeY
MSRPGIFRPPTPRNEPVRDYAPGSPERSELTQRLEQMKAERLDLASVIGGEDVRTGDTFEAVMPHDKDHVLADVHKGGAAEVEQAIQAAIRETSAQGPRDQGKVMGLLSSRLRGRADMKSVAATVQTLLARDSQ